MFSSEMLNFSMNNHALLAHRDGVLHQESDADQSSRPVEPGNGSFANSTYPVSSNFAPSTWKGIGSQQSCDWIVNYVNGSDGNACNQSPLFVGEILPGTVKESNLSASSMYLKPGCNGYPDVQSSSANPASVNLNQDGQKQYGEINFSSPAFYQNTLQEVVTSSTIGRQGFEITSFAQKNIRETSHGPWVDGANGLASRLNNTAAWLHRPMEGTHQWNEELGFSMNKSGRNLENIASDFAGRGLSLSLSSRPPELNVTQFGERFGSESLQSRTGICSTSQDLKTSNSSYLFSESKSSIANKGGYGNSVQEIVGSSTYAGPSTGPFGPFTGYATILKSSKFMKPAQLLLDEICCVTGPKLISTYEMSGRGSRDVSFSSDPIDAEIEVCGRVGNSTVSTSFYSSNETAGGESGIGSESCQSLPVFQQNKAKLFYMQEEVCRRYKQYHQQMQMVMSSFESVAGLSASTPYTSLALKTISRQFRCLKNAISDQLRHVSMALGEDLSSPVAGTSNGKGDMTVPGLSFIDQSVRKQKANVDGLGFLEPQQHIWRPQRGLPERAVSVLRAWLFEHFLHPYPTDTDKHMLATKTGLSRNQVSNWFINARVRLWKPMVEEIHMLETKATAEMDPNSGKNNPSADGSSSKQKIDAISEKESECSIVEAAPNAEASRVECQTRTDVDGSLMGFLPYNHQSRLEIGGLGSVSLTLGLRHSGVSAQQQQQEQQPKRQCGGQMIPDIVG